MFHCECFVVVVVFCNSDGCVWSSYVYICLRIELLTARDLRLKSHQRKVNKYIYYVLCSVVYIFTLFLKFGFRAKPKGGSCTQWKYMLTQTHTFFSLFIFNTNIHFRHVLLKKKTTGKNAQKISIKFTVEYTKNFRAVGVFECKYN